MLPLKSTGYSAKNMKNTFFRPGTYWMALAFACFSLLGAGTLNAQNKTQREKVPVTAEIYDTWKQAGKLNPNVDYVISNPTKQGTLSGTQAANAKNMLKMAQRAQLASPPCSYIPTQDFDDPWGGEVYFDDAPPAGDFEVQIPFEFCFYGTPYTSFFINNNGNITFEQAYITFTSQSFPAAGIPPMIAPFWGDVDTGSPTNPLGQVRYTVFPTYAVVSWDTVAVYNEIGTLRNTFQVMISDGQSSVLPPGTNIAFLYADMQWTTGDASQGIGGFGGTPATVGVNRGDGVDYIQLGRFDAPGTNYDGPFGANDQVSFLDNTVYFFNTCLEPGVQNNIAPLAIGAPLCDTIPLCVGEDYVLDFNFIPVEPGQLVSAELITTAVPGFFLANDPTTPLAQRDVQGVFSANVSNIGYNTITFTATDDGTPAATYTINLTFQVIDNGFTPTILGVPNICEGQATTLSVGGGNYDQYVWSPNNEETSTIDVTTPGSYQVTVSIGNCIGTSEPYAVGVAALPTPVIEGQDTVCGSQLAALFTTEAYSAYLWSNFNGNDTIQVGAGTYTVTVTDTNGCQGTTPAFTVVEVNAITPVIVGDNHTCFDEVSYLSTATTYVSYQWSDANGTTNPTLGVNEGQYTVTVTDVNGCQGVSAPFIVSNSAPNPDILGLQPFCKYDSIYLYVNDTFALYRWVYEGDTLSTTDSLHWNGGSATNAEAVILVADNFGCTATDTLNAPWTELPVAAIATTPPTTPAILKNVLITFNDASTATNGDPLVDWQWVFLPPDDTLYGNSQTQTYPDTGVKQVTLIVTSQLGCRDTIVLNLPIIDKPFVPNVFSPNGDGKNDYFKIPFLYGYPNNQVAVFNRWGNKVFEASNYNNDWSGDDLPSGTYFYVVSAPDLADPLKGAVTIIRE